MRPEYLTRSSIPATALEAEIEKIKTDFGTSLKGKPAPVVERMIEGKLKKFYEDNVLLDQPFFADLDKDPKTVRYISFLIPGQNYITFRLENSQKLRVKLKDLKSH